MHLHALIGGCTVALVNERTCFWLMRQWEELGGGIARVRVYDDSLAGEDYVVKDLVTRPITAGNAYETCKFTVSDQVMVSKSVIRYCSTHTQPPAVG